VQLSVGAFDISLDLAASPPALTMSTSGIALGSGPVLSGSARVDTSGAWSGAVSAAGAASFGSPGLDVQLGGSGVAPSVGLTFGTPPDGVPDRITLYPPPSAGQLAGIAQAALAAAGAAALRTLIAAMRAGLLSAAQRAKLDPVLSGLRLLTGTGDQAVPAVPFGIFTDPAGYLRHAIGWSAGTGPAADQVAVPVQLQPQPGAGAQVHQVGEPFRACLFIPVCGGGDAAALAKALNRAAGFFRARLAGSVDLRVAPTVRFAPDLSFDNVGRIERLLQDPAVVRDLKKDGDDGA